MVESSLCISMLKPDLIDAISPEYSWKTLQRQFLFSCLLLVFADQRVGKISIRGLPEFNHF